MAQAPIDYVVLGEGEETAIALFRALEMGLDVTVIPGIAHRDADGNCVHERAPRPDPQHRRDPVAGVAAVRRQGIRREQVRHRHPLRPHGADPGHPRLPVPVHLLLVARACGRRAGTRGRRRTWPTRSRPTCEKFGANNFPFQDLTAILKRDWVVEFAKRDLRSRPSTSPGSCPPGRARRSSTTRSRRLLVQSGCRSLNFAPESGSERTRKHMKKMLTDEKLFRAVNAAVKNGLNVGCFLVHGLPDRREAGHGGHRADDPAAGARWRRRRVGGFFFPLPNTEITRELEKQGRR